MKNLEGIIESQVRSMDEIAATANRLGSLAEVLQALVEGRTSAAQETVSALRNLINMFNDNKFKITIYRH